GVAERINALTEDGTPLDEQAVSRHERGVYKPRRFYRRLYCEPAPRGALSYPRSSREELEGRVLGLMAYLARKRRRGTTACQENSGRVQAYEARRCGTRATRLKLDCLYHNLQKVQIHARRKDACNRRRNLHRHQLAADATFGMRSDAQRGYSRR